MNAVHTCGGTCPDCVAMRTARALAAVFEILEGNKRDPERAGRPQSPGSPPASAVADGPVGDG